MRAGPTQAPEQAGGRAPDPDLVVHIPVPARAWWDDVVATCSNIRLCCNQAHVDVWARAKPPPRTCCGGAG